MLNPNPHRGAFRRYLQTNSTATAFNTALARGAIITAAQATAANMFAIGKSLTAQIIFFGTDAANESFDYRVWAAYRLSGYDGSLDSAQYIVQPLGAGTATLGTMTGVATGTALINTDFVADTVAFTASDVATTSSPSVVGPGVIGPTAMAEGTSAAYDATTPNNDVACLYLPSLLRCTGLIIDFNNDAGGTDSASANCLIMCDEI